jgi:hypothetical protein
MKAKGEGGGPPRLAALQGAFRTAIFTAAKDLSSSLGQGRGTNSEDSSFAMLARNDSMG